MTQRAESGRALAVPQVIASYATYLRTKTRAEPQISLSGSRAEISAGVRDRTLVLAFGYRKYEWSLDSAEILHDDEHAMTFGRHELTKAVAALLAI